MVVSIRRTGRKSIIDGLLTPSMAPMGTGYVYWADTLNVVTEVTTDDFGMTLANLGLYAQYGNGMTSNDWSIVDSIGDKTYANDTFSTGAAADCNKIVCDYSIDAYRERQKGYNSVELVFYTYLRAYET